MKLYHQQDLSNASFLVTGGAGFIGSSLVDYLLRHGAGRVRVLDNFSNGLQSNLTHAASNPAFELIEGDITNPDDCRRACAGMTHVSHQAALGSVPRSVANPLATHEANATGFLNMLIAARDAGIRRFVYASSSSVYGDSAELPKVEARTGNPLSPYAVTKATNELYARVFGHTYGMETIGLRYFNVFGPHQRPDGPYAAVIPLFVRAARENQPPLIHGDGGQTRDFTYVDNAVEANVRAMLTDNQQAFNEAFNVAVGERVSLNQLWQYIQQIAGIDYAPTYGPTRGGDIRHSLANIDKATTLLGYAPQVTIRTGLERVWASAPMPVVVA